MKLHDYEIEEILISILSENEDLKALVDDNIFPIYIEKDTTGDAVYYDSELSEPEMCKMGNAKSIMHFFICAVCNRMEHANRIIGIIQDALEGKFSDPQMSIRAVGTAKDGSDNKYAKTMEFIIEW